MQRLRPLTAWKTHRAFFPISITAVMCRLLFPAIYFLTSVLLPLSLSFSAQRCFPHPFFYFSTMSQSTTSDLVSTIATQLNIVIVALRLLVDMIQNPDAASPVDMTSGSCPSRPPASPASSLFQTATRPSISWAPCEQPEQPVPRSELSPLLSRTPSPSPTSSAGKRTPPASSPTLHPPLPPSAPPPFPLPSLSPLPADAGAPSSPPLLSFLPSPVLSPPDFAYPPPSSQALLPPSPSPSCSLVSSAPMAPFPPVPANAAHLPPPPRLLLPFSLHPLPPAQTHLGKTIGAPKMMTSSSASNAMNDFDPVGATLPRRCSAQNPKSALVGLNFLNYNGWLHPDLHL